MDQTGDQVREASIADIPALARLKRDTFRQTFLEDFAVPYPPDDLAHFERVSYGEDVIAAELADPLHKSWVVEGAGRLIAYCHAGPCKLPHQDARTDHGELYQLYLLREAQGEGLGACLLTHAMAYLQQAFAGPLWLGVWSGNERAQRFYTVHGFKHAGQYEFPVGAWRDKEYIYRLDR